MGHDINTLLDEKSYTDDLMIIIFNSFSVLMDIDREIEKINNNESDKTLLVAEKGLTMENYMDILVAKKQKTTECVDTLMKREIQKVLSNDKNVDKEIARLTREDKEKITPKNLKEYLNLMYLFMTLGNSSYNHLD
jgi:hypothetical protein